MTELGFGHIRRAARFENERDAALGWVRMLATGYDHEGERECSHCHALVSDGCDDDCALAAYLKATLEPVKE